MKTSTWMFPAVRIALAVTVVIGLFVVANGGAPFARAATFLVNSTLDEPDATPGDGLCISAPGALCTLRAAIDEANFANNSDDIQVPAGVYNVATVLTISTPIAIAPVAATDQVTISGPAIFLVALTGNLQLSQVTLSAASTAPAIDVAGGALSVTTSTLSGNTAGAIRLVDGTATIETTTISGNSGGAAAGVDVSGTATATLTHVTVAANAGGVGVGGLLAGATATVNLTGSILADNTGASADCDGTINATGPNIIEAAGVGCVVGGTAPTVVDPGLGALGNNGGPTFTQRPLSTSAAIDTAGVCGATDQRGVSRPRGGACDLGAVELPVITFSTLTYSPTDSNTSVGLLATIGTSVPFAMSVPYTLVDDTAVAGVDYTGPGGSFSFLANVANATSGVTILRNPLVTGDSAFTAVIGSTGPAVVGNGPASITITDVDPVVSWSGAPYTVGESAGSLVVTALLNSVDPTNDTIVTFQTVAGSARPGVEYTTVAAGTITVPANTLSATGSVTILPNGWDASANKTFTVQLVSTSRGTLSITPDAAVTIADDESAPLARMAETNYPATEPASGSVNVNLLITLPYTSELDISVNYATANGVGVAGALAGADYTATSGTAAILSNTDTFTVPVQILNNTWYSGSQQLTFNLTGASAGSPASATVDIADGEPLPLIDLGTLPNQSENVGSVGIAASIPYTSEVPLIVDYTTVAGTAQPGRDYTTTVGSLTITAPDTSASISVSIIDNTFYSGAQSFSVQLGTQSPGGPNNDSTTVTVLDNDLVPEASVPATFSVNEADGTAFVPITLDTAALSDVVVTYTVTPGTATPGAYYQPAGTTVTFASLDTAEAIPVTIVQNGFHSGSATFTIQLQSQSIGSPEVTASSVVVTIVDDDPVPSASIETPGSGGYAYSELAGSAVVTVTIPYTSTSDIDFSFATSDGTAHAGVDYVATSNSLTIPAGQTSATISIPIINNGVFTLDRFFAFTISGQSPGTIGSPASAQVTIIDAQQQPTVQFQLPSFNVLRNVGTAPITVTLSAATGINVTVAYTMSNGTALAGVDYTSSSGTLTFVAGEVTKYIQVPILNSGLYVGDRNFNLGLSNPNQAVLGDNAQATVLIRETNARRSYLPQIRLNYDPFRESEPNATRASASGPVTSGAIYRGRFNLDRVDPRYNLDIDTWVFTVSGPGQVTVTVTSNDPGRQVKLINSSGADIPGGFSGDPGPTATFTVNVTAAGTYYVRVYNSSQLGTNEYQLRITHP